MSMRETPTAVKVEVIEERIRSDAVYAAKFNAAAALRSVALRPRYMHNASQATLHDVMKHYEKAASTARAARR